MAKHDHRSELGLIEVHRGKTTNLQAMPYNVRYSISFIFPRPGLVDEWGGAFLSLGAVLSVR